MQAAESVMEPDYAAATVPRLQVDEGIIAGGVEGHAAQHGGHDEGPHERRLWLYCHPQRLPRCHVCQLVRYLLTTMRQQWMSVLWAT